MLEQINEILTNNDSENSNFTRRSIFKIFINWLSNINKDFIPFETKIKKFKWINGTRTAFSKNELSFILEEVKNYNNLKFETIFLIFLSNGIRVSEWKNIDWNELKRNNWNININVAKKGNTRIFNIPNHGIFENLRNNILKLNLDLKPKTIKNLFYKFSYFVKKRNPNFKHTISTHILRYNFATQA